MNIKVYPILTIIVAALVTLSVARAAEEARTAAEPPKAEIAKKQAAASRAATKIEANKAELGRLVKAAKSRNTNEAKAILAKNGFDAKDVKLKIRDETGGSTDTARIKIKLSITCCPLEGELTLTF
jgi:hypothetical protein